MRRKWKKALHMSATDPRGAAMGAELLYTDAKWLAKLCERIELAASRAHPKDQFYTRITTTEVKRAHRIAGKLRWLLQHLDIGDRAGESLDIVPRGNIQPEDPK